MQSPLDLKSVRPLLRYLHLWKWVNGVHKPRREIPHICAIPCSFHSPEGRRKISSRPQQAALAYKQWEAAIISNSPFSFNELSLKPAPSNFLFFSVKGQLFSFVLRACLWFTIACLSQIAIPLLFPNKLDFAGWITYLFLLKKLTYILPSWHWPVLWAIPEAPSYVEIVNAVCLKSFPEQTHKYINKTT